MIVTGAQASAYVTYLNQQSGGAIIFQPFMFWLSTTIVLTAGTLFVMWLGEKITDRGIGNGVSLLIMVGIFARLPSALLQEGSAKIIGQGGGGGIFIFLLEMVVFIAVIVG